MIALPRTDVPLRQRDQLFIAGTWVNPSSRAQFVVIDPATEEPFFEVAEALAPDVSAAAAAARDAFDHGPWPRLSPPSGPGTCTGWGGATLAVGGRRPAHLERGWFVEPTVFGNVDNSMTIAQEEIFGPVLSVIPAEDEEHAITIANDTIYGLNSSVFTNDADHALAVARRLRSGTVGHNAFRSDFGVPAGYVP